jgi:hypothetical protein
VQVVGSPVWSEDGTQVLVSISSGTIVSEDPCRKIEWGPSSIVMLDIEADELEPILVKGDNEHNYSLQVELDGQYEIVSEPYAPFYSECCRG